MAFRQHRLMTLRQSRLALVQRRMTFRQDRMPFRQRLADQQRTRSLPQGPGGIESGAAVTAAPGDEDRYNKTGERSHCDTLHRIASPGVTRPRVLDRRGVADLN
jgi:hypothetical protein